MPVPLTRREDRDMPESPLIDGCLTALGAPPDGGLPGVLSRTSLRRFELLQTPGLWERDPADASAWMPSADGSPPWPAACRRLLEAIEEVCAQAESLLDIASLEPHASGEFAAAIRRGLARAARRGAAPVVRILYGRHGYERRGFTLQTCDDFDAFVAGLAADVPAESRLRVYGCTMKTASALPAPSWNHAKIVAADGRQAIVGGHNLWHADYLTFPPVHDVSALVEGRAAGEAHAFLDQLWGWVARHHACPPDGAIAHVACWAGGLASRAVPPADIPRPGGPAGGIPALAVGRLGSGVVPDLRRGNAGAAVAAAAFRQAHTSIRISQMDFGFHWEGVNSWSADVVAAIADVLTDPARRVEVAVVLSELGAETAAGGPYSFGTSIPDVVAELRRVIGTRSLTGRMRIAPLRVWSSGDRWGRDGATWKFSNHAKVWIVDDRAVHVGSDNLYPHGLQEFGYVIESIPIVCDVLATYWEPMWRSSSRVATEL
jgi:phosphatidylserine/phosphatidylglycerophosphate/cardiolipin synthase-like enzyme